MRIALIDDHAMIRDLLRALCTTDKRHEIVADAATGPEAVREISVTKPDLIILDLNLPGFDGFTVIEQIRKLGLAPRILVLSASCSNYTIYRAECSAIDGFIDKISCRSKTIHEALETIEAKGVYFTTTYVDLKLARLSDPRAFETALSARECTILSLFGLLLEDSEIAQRLGISAATVEKHRFNIYSKLALKTRAELLRYVRDTGFLSLTETPSP